MTGYPERLAQVLEDFACIADPAERAAYLIEYADRLQDVPPHVAVRPFPEAHRVPSCESEAFVWVEPQTGGALKLHFAVENPQGLSAKALAAILDEALSGLPADEVMKIDPEIVFTLFGRNVSMGRGQGLTSMVAMVREQAARCAASAASG